ncbi:MAG: cytochrome ubiquinol oxidase subunit I [Bacteroidales bacterium]|nr:cytochrome ubiquinol oxidase subunit I [Bacteroidales bacterium]
MIDGFDYTLIDWSRGQFALTAMFHWIFVPLTLGLSFIIAMMETFYVKTGNPEWKRITKFWMKLFGINFAIGVATGIILEFEFGTNWSKYSWFVGDIFGAPLAIEGIMAFFMESTFIAIMFFGWDKVSKKAHLISTWLVAVGSNLSALWILIANAWMQDPVGMQFNPDTARNEMVDFWAIALSPMAVNKFLHTITSAYTLSAIFVIGVSAYYMKQNRHQSLAKKSMLLASVFGILSIFFTIFSGDNSAREVAKKQPMKFAAMEGMYNGQTGAGLVALGIMTSSDDDPENKNVKDFAFKIEIPNILSYMAFLDWNAFVPGINDLINGNPEQGIIPVAQKVKMGKLAIQSLADYKNLKKAGELKKAEQARIVLEQNFKYFGYGYFENDMDKLIPNVPVSFYSFHLMVALGFWFIIVFGMVIWRILKKDAQFSKLWLTIFIFTVPLAYIASEAGWVTAEMGRQPWVIQDLMPTMAAVSYIDSTTVQVTFWMFLVIFSGLLIAELKIMLTQIKQGPKEEGTQS